jgi:hypothetical protein
VAERTSVHNRVPTFESIQGLYTHLDQQQITTNITVLIVHTSAAGCSSELIRAGMFSPSDLSDVVKERHPFSPSKHLAITRRSATSSWPMCPFSLCMHYFNASRFFRDRAVHLSIYLLFPNNHPGLYYIPAHRVLTFLPQAIYFHP